MSFRVYGSTSKRWKNADQIEEPPLKWAPADTIRQEVCVSRQFTASAIRFSLQPNHIRFTRGKLPRSWNSRDRDSIPDPSSPRPTCLTVRLMRCACCHLDSVLDDEVSHRRLLRFRSNGQAVPRSNFPRDCSWTKPPGIVGLPRLRRLLRNSCSSTES